MQKKLLSVLLSIIVLITCMTPVAMSVSAATFASELEKKGFPSSYINALVELHQKYPKWNFEVFNTGLSWSAAVAGERSNHSKQLIQKRSGLTTVYYCDCSSCKKNGNYVIQEGSSWVSASEKAVKYYMDPRNWLSEKYIFQFESTSYDSTQTQEGIESILASTWMHKSNISYVNTEGKTVLHKRSNGDTVKYSSCILSAAKNSGMSAYYLASKIVQEVGNTTPTAGGVVGTRLPFKGIYNYYNIGAYSTATQGLAWAAGFLKSEKATTLYSSYNSSTKKGSGTKTSVASGQYMTYIGSYGDYYKVRLYNENGSSYTTNGKVGYVLKSHLRTTYFNYGRPWFNPFRAIYNGATYIANSFSKYQNTGYLQKFNVNKASGNLYNHEYMANVQAAADEAAITYKAYQKADILKTSKTFYIPVYNSMPAQRCTMTSSSSAATTSSSTKPSTTVSSSSKVTGLTLKGRTTESLSFSWNKVSGAAKYYIYIKNNTKNTTFNKTVTSNSAKLNGLSAGNEYSVRVKAYTSKGWTAYSTYNTKHTTPAAVKSLKVSARSSTSVTLKWNKVTGAKGYYVYRYIPSKKSMTKIKTITNPSTTSAKISSLKSGTTYYYYVSAYVADGSSKKEGSKGSRLTAVTSPVKTQLSSVTSPSKTKIKTSWKKVSGSASGYQIYYSRDSKFKNVVAKKSVSGQAATSYTGKNFTKGVKYYIKVRAYRTVGGKTYYGAWSSVKTVVSK